MSRQRGFTLLELLLALSIFALMSAMAYSGLTATLNAREGINAALDRTQSIQLAIFRMRADLEQTTPRGIRDQFGDSQPALLGSAENGITFTRNGWRNPLGERRSNLQRVGYRLDDNGKLLRLHWRVLDRAQDSAPLETELLSDVESMEWRYLAENYEWIDRWPQARSDINRNPDAAPDNSLPRAVELRLETATLGEIRHLFYIVQPQGQGQLGLPGQPSEENQAEPETQETPEAEPGSATQFGL